MSLKERLDGLSEDLKAKAKECKTQEDLIKLIGEAGIDLSPDDLNQVAGGVLAPLADLRPGYNETGGQEPLKLRP